MTASNGGEWPKRVNGIWGYFLSVSFMKSSDDSFPTFRSARTTVLPFWEWMAEAAVPKSEAVVTEYFAPVSTSFANSRNSGSSSTRRTRKILMAGRFYPNQAAREPGGRRSAGGGRGRWRGRGL